MITQTPPRKEGVSTMARKRERPSFAHDMSLSFSAPSGASVGNNAPSPHHDNTTIMNTTSSALFSSSPHHNHGGSIASAAKVSPFTDRLSLTSNSTSNARHNMFSYHLFKLEPVPEESHTDNENGSSLNLSQTSTTSSLTFASSCSNNDSNNVIASDSSLKMDYSSCGSISMDGSQGGSQGGGGGAMIGTLVRGAGDSIGPAPTISLNTTFEGFPPFHNQECAPPTKRARVDPGPHKMYQEINDEDINMDGAAFESPNKMNTVKSINNLRFTNIDKYENGNKLCCHVCSQEASAHMKNNPNATAKASSISYLGCDLTADAPPTPTPRSHSLLAYFQPAKKSSTATVSSNPMHNGHGRNTNQHHFTSETSQHDTCQYCDKPTCITCTRQCEQCQHRFCTFCTKVDYESSVTERILCFECDEYARSNGNDSRDCDMMDL